MESNVVRVLLIYNTHFVFVLILIQVLRTHFRAVRKRAKKKVTIKPEYYR